MQTANDKNVRINRHVVKFAKCKHGIKYRLTIGRRFYKIGACVRTT